MIGRQLIRRSLHYVHDVHFWFYCSMILRSTEEILIVIGSRARNRWQTTFVKTRFALVAQRRTRVFFRHGVPTSLSLHSWKIITFRNFRQRRAYPVGMQADRSRAGGRGVTVRYCNNNRPIRGVAATQTQLRVVVYVENPAKRLPLSTCRDIYRGTRRYVRFERFYIKQQRLVIFVIFIIVYIRIFMI